MIFNLKDNVPTPYVHLIKGLIACILIWLTFASSPRADEFMQRAANDKLPVASGNEAVQLTYFGTSSFLIDDGFTQILIDGFVTRHKHRIFGRIHPHLNRVKDMARKHGICNAPKFQKSPNNPANCLSPAGRSLELIIPAHAHYDHALDAPYFSALTGATLLADNSVIKLADAARTYEEKNHSELDWRRLEQRPIFLDDNKSHRDFSVGSFDIRLIKTNHNRNFTSKFLNGKTKKFRFPAWLWQMKEGTAVSIHITHGDRKFLIVPSITNAGTTFSELNTEADVVFLGIGGLGRQKESHNTELWENIVRVAKPERVVLIHWDNDQKTYDGSAGNFPEFKIYNSIKALKTFDRLAKEDGVQISFAPPEAKFDPFVHLSRK